MDSIQSLPIDSLAKAGFLLFLLVYSIVTFVIYYHWRNYGTDPRMIKLTISSYFFITVPLVMSLGVLAYFVF